MGGKNKFNPLASNDGVPKKRRSQTIINAAAIQKTSKKRKQTVAKPTKKRLPPVPTSTRPVVRVPSKLYKTLDYNKKICFSEFSPMSVNFPQSLRPTYDLECHATLLSVTQNFPRHAVFVTDEMACYANEHRPFALAHTGVI